MSQSRVFHSTAPSIQQGLILIEGNWLILGGKKICRIENGHLEIKDTQAARSAIRESEYCYIPIDDLLEALNQALSQAL